MINNSGYIYKTENLRNGRIYIGKKEGRFNPNYLGSGILISRAINKYGTSSFRLEVLAMAKDRSKLCKLEKRFISEYKKAFPKRIYNIAEGGHGGATHWTPCSTEKKAKKSCFKTVEQSSTKRIS